MRLHTHTHLGTDDNATIIIIVTKAVRWNGLFWSTGSDFDSFLEPSVSVDGVRSWAKRLVVTTDLRGVTIYNKTK